jgi:transcriptional regulator with XRE-family HTH domain
VRLSPDRIKELCARRGVSLQSFLESAGVSRTAYYSLIRRNSVLPRSVQAMAGMLGVASSAILEEESPVPGRARALIREAGSVLAIHPRATFENVWHTLVLLDEPPIERLRRSLLRGRTHDLH